MDCNKLPSEAVIRTRRDGDYIRKFGGGTKSLGDYLTDKKVPLRIREQLMVCANESEILFVCGIDISSSICIDNNTTRVLVVQNI